MQLLEEFRQNLLKVGMNEKMNVLMIGVDETSIGGMLTVVNNYKNNKEFCKMTNLKYVATVIRSNKLVKIKTFLCKIPEIISTIRNDKIDIVHVHMAERGSVFREGFVVLLANVMGCKTVIHMHGADIEDWYNKQFVLIKKLIANIFCAADVMIVLGDNWLPFMRSVMVGHEEKIKVLHNAVYVEAENKANANATDILFYGMLIKRKGIEDLLAAFEKIKDDIPKNIHLRLYGDNKEVDALKKLKEYHLERKDNKPNFYIQDKALIFTYQSCHPYYIPVIDSLLKVLDRETKNQNITKFVLDLRGNGGGASAIIKPLIEYLKNTNLELVTIVDKGVFSSGRFACVAMQMIGSKVVGEQIGTPINCFGNVLRPPVLTNTTQQPIFAKTYWYLDDDKEKMVGINEKKELLKYDKDFFKPKFLELDEEYTETLTDFVNDYDIFLKKALANQTKIK